MHMEGCVRGHLIGVTSLLSYVLGTTYGSSGLVASATTLRAQGLFVFTDADRTFFSLGYITVKPKG